MATDELHRDYVLIDDFDDPTVMGYDWAIFGVWGQRATGRLYTAADGGCSCYYPWQDMTVADLDPAADVGVIAERAQKWTGGGTEVAEWVRHDLPSKIKDSQGRAGIGEPSALLTRPAFGLCEFDSRPFRIDPSDPVTTSATGVDSCPTSG